MQSRLFCFVLLAAGVLPGLAQPYLTSTFSDISVETDLLYAENYSVLSVPITGDPTLEALRLDLYTPQDNGAAERPLVLMVGTSTFLPQEVSLSVHGTRRDSVNVETAIRLAKLGYVVAVLEHRVGWNPISGSFSERIGTYFRAVYRAQQDVRAAVRFFQKSAAEMGNPYKTCADRIVLWGIDSGGMVATAAAYLDSSNDLLIPKLIGENLAPYAQADIDGNLDGTNTTIYPNLPGDPLANDTLNVPNHAGYDSGVNLVVNIGGGIIDESWIDANDPPVLAFHVPSDPIAPYGTGLLVALPTGDLLLEVSGSYDLVRIANELGINDALGDAQIDDVYTDAANEDNDGYAGLFPLTDKMFLNALGDTVVERDPYNWWDGEFWSNVFISDICAPPFTPYECSYDYYAKLTHENNDAAEARLVIDSMINYFAPRAFNALDLGTSAGSDCAFTDVDDLPAVVAQLRLAPNPAQTDVLLSTDSDLPMRTVSVFDARGRLVRFRDGLSARQLTIVRGTLPAGLYHVRVRFDEGLVTHRLVLQ